MSRINDYQRYGEYLQRELDALDDGPYCEADARAVKRWVTKIDGSVTEGTIQTYLRNLRKTAERLDTPIVELSEALMDEHVYDLRHNPEYGRGSDPGLSDGTIRNVEFVIRKLHTDLELSEWADDYELTPQPDNNVRPEDMLKEEDIRALCDATKRLRDTAIIEFLSDTAARLSMMATLRVKDVDLEGEVATYTPNEDAAGLKGAPIHEYPLIDSRATLRSYLRNAHPRPNDPDAAFIHRLPGNGFELEERDGTVAPNTIRSLLNSIAADAGVDKPTNPHNFRHSAVTRMRREGYDRAEVEHRVHWSIDTDMWETYEHIAAEEHNQSIFEKAGILEPDEDTLDRTRRRCGNCTETVAPHHDYCPQCGDAVSRDAREVQDAARDTTLDTIAELEDRLERLKTRELHSHVDSRGDHVAPPSSSSSDDR
ncbi:tyrosine-type recombinase/integrase [Halorubrum rubrum]|uniref:Tyrosine-type recombinase/integrase n=1 Tax=Halorubrum rubrum TaxID=1126240 RepID=A0ABD5R1F9_9EURY|nr:tyrosine-type recombinase/integrase [Halorubrum rubrum]